VNDVLGRDPQRGARVKGGVHLIGRRGGFDHSGAYERRIDGFPAAAVFSGWSEAGLQADLTVKSGQKVSAETKRAQPFPRW
jgi:hypothetical protein